MKRRMMALVLGVLLVIGAPNINTVYAETDSDTQEENYGYIDTGERTEYYVPADGNENAVLYNSVLPEKYDSREYGRVTSVKNQGAFGTCWAFAAIGEAESSLLTQGLVNQDIDLSEYQFAYFFYHYAVDSLENLKNDYSRSMNGSYLMAGGNNYYSMFALSSWRGTGKESLAPYEEVTTDSSLDTDLAFDDVAHMQNAYIISMRNMKDVKQQIVSNGAVASSIYMNEYKYYNASTGGYYQNATMGANHAIMIVGWDDNYSVDNFNTDCRPQNNGAWLIKNSWGPYIDYFWASYEDKCLANQDAFSYIFELADNYDYNYQYDGAYGSSYGYIENDCSIANVFRCDGADSQEIKAVSIALKDSNVHYSVQVYLNPEEGNPKKGTPMLENSVSGDTTYAGYYTVKLNESIKIDKGDTFAVVFTLSSNDESKSSVAYYADCTMPGEIIQFESYTEPKTMYLYNYPYYDPYMATDLYNAELGWCPRIKAFTDVSDESGGCLISDCSVTVEDQEYTGEAIMPSVLVRYKGRLLTEGIDYTLAYRNNIEKGTGTVVVTGTGRYIGNQEKAFQIVTKLNPTSVYNGVDYSAVYDYNYYVRKYKDIWNTFGKDDKAVIQHFVENGMNEGRQGNATFNVTSYAYKYYDLRRTFKNDLKQYYMHYIRCGKAEGRMATGTSTMQGGVTVYKNVDYAAVYNVGYYSQKYADLRRVFGFDDAAYIEHFVNYGMSEGRQGNKNFNVMSYAYKYYDLRKAFKNELRQYYMHYINCGKKEGRIATGTSSMQGGITVYKNVDYADVYSVGYYSQRYADLRKAFGLDDEAYLEHFVNNGMAEGRQGIKTFSAKNYRNRYSDLRKIFGTDMQAYYMHYINYGKAEGRNGN